MIAVIRTLLTCVTVFMAVHANYSASGRGFQNGSSLIFALLVVEYDPCSPSLSIIWAVELSIRPICFEIEIARDLVHLWGLCPAVLGSQVARQRCWQGYQGICASGKI